MTAILQILALVLVASGLLSIFGAGLAVGLVIFGIGSTVLALAWILEELRKIEKKV